MLGQSSRGGRWRAWMISPLDVPPRAKMAGKLHCEGVVTSLNDRFWEDSSGLRSPRGVPADMARKRELFRR